MAHLSLQHIYKEYDNGFQAVSDFNLEIMDGEFIVFVGPSGCGKSTTLRMIARLEDISRGEYYLDDQLMNSVEPKDCDIAMVFQSYALYPHMSIYDNMAFALKIKKVPKDQIEKRIQKAADMLGLTDLLKRKPKALSGGQRQRVALGRAVVREPKVMLMDEPLSNLDAKLRGHMRAEIIKLHQRIGATTIYVTHDQIEAMTMADRIVVMKDGIVQQIDTPKVIYDTPNNIFVASFIGTPAMNFIKVLYTNGKIKFQNMEIDVPEGKAKALNEAQMDGKEVIFGIRPEDIGTSPLLKETYPSAAFKATIDFAELLGHDYNLHFSCDEHEYISKIEARKIIKNGDQIELIFDMNKAFFFDIDTELAIR